MAQARAPIRRSDDRRVAAAVGSAAAASHARGPVDRRFGTILGRLARVGARVARFVDVERELARSDLVSSSPVYGPVFTVPCNMPCPVPSRYHAPPQRLQVDRLDPFASTRSPRIVSWPRWSHISWHAVLTPSSWPSVRTSPRSICAHRTRSRPSRATTARPMRRSAPSPSPARCSSPSPRTSRSRSALVHLHLR